MIDFNKISAIYYFHVMNEGILDTIKYLKSHDKLNSILIFADDGHISIKDYLDYIDYVPIIGRCIQNRYSKNVKQDENTPLVQYNLQSALYNSLLGCNSGFMCIDDIPYEKRLNHTQSHNKKRLFAFDAHIVDIFNKEDCKNWWYFSSRQNEQDFNIYNDYIPIHLQDYYSSFRDEYYAHSEVFNLYPYIKPENREIVVAPWNIINENFMKVCYNMNVRYIVYSDVYDLVQNRNLGIPRINLEKFV